LIFKEEPLRRSRNVPPYFALRVWYFLQFALNADFMYLMTKDILNLIIIWYNYSLELLVLENNIYYWLVEV